MEGYSLQEAKSNRYATLVWYSKEGPTPKGIPKLTGIPADKRPSMHSTISVILSESSPRHSPFQTHHGPTRTIGGHPVLFRTVAESENGNAYSAEWKSNEATYMAVANGTTEDEFVKVIGCMP